MRDTTLYEEVTRLRAKHGTLLEYLTGLKSRRDKLEAKLLFCAEHNMHEEERWIRRELDILCGEYVEIHNKVLGIYF
jgi:hypothetical protein